MAAERGDNGSDAEKDEDLNPAERPEEVDLDALLAETAANIDSTLGEEQKQAEADRLEQERLEVLREKTGDDYKARQNTLAELRADNEEQEEINSSGIEQKLQNQGQVEQEIAATQAELDAIPNQIEAQQAIIDKIKTATKNIELTDENIEKFNIPVKVVEAYRTAQTQVAVLEGKQRTLPSGISEMQKSLISDETTNRHRELGDKIEGNEIKMGEIESNPYLVELLHAEGIGIQKAIGELVRNVEMMDQNPGEERSKYIETVCTRFFLEEVKAAGIEQIENPRERAAKIASLGIELTHAYQQTNNLHRVYDDIRISLLGHRAPSNFQVEEAHKQTSLISKGVALACLTGQKNSDSLFQYLAYIDAPETRISAFVGDNRQQKQDQSIGHQISVHLGSINYTRAVSLGTGESTEILKSASKAGTDRHSGNGLVPGFGYVQDERPFIPEEATPRQKKEIELRFYEDAKAAAILASTDYSKKIERIQTDIAEANVAMEPDQKMIEENKQAKETLFSDPEIKQKIGTPNADDLNSFMRDINTYEKKTIWQLTDEFQKAESALAQLKEDLNSLPESPQPRKFGLPRRDPSRKERNTLITDMQTAEERRDGAKERLDKAQQIHDRAFDLLTRVSRTWSHSEKYVDTYEAQRRLSSQESQVANLNQLKDQLNKRISSLSTTITELEAEIEKLSPAKA